MELFKILIFRIIKNILKICLQKVPRQFFDNLQQPGFSKSSKVPHFTVSGIVRFSKKVNLRFKNWFSHGTRPRYPNLGFIEPSFFRPYAFFLNLSLPKPPRFLLETKRGPLRVFGTMLNFPKEKKFFQRMSFFQLMKISFRVLWSMKGTLWVSRNCFLSFFENLGAFGA